MTRHSLHASPILYDEAQQLTANAFYDATDDRSISRSPGAGAQERAGEGSEEKAGKGEGQSEQQREPVQEPVHLGRMAGASPSMRSRGGMRGRGVKKELEVSLQFDSSVVGF